MNMLRTILIGLASFVFMGAVIGFMYLFTLQTTVMDRTIVKNWLSESKIYDGRLINALVQTTNAGGGQNGAPQPVANTFTISPEAIKNALNATFTSEFTQTQIEGVVNNAYDWISGSSPDFTFSIPIDQKRDTLITQLAKEITPQIAALPVCRASQFAQASTCRPPNMTVEQVATQLTTQSIDESGAFAKPITNASFANTKQNTGQQPEQTTLSRLPAVRKATDMLLIALPIAAAVSLLAIILGTTSGHRLARIARLSRRVFFGMLFIFLPVIIIVWLAKDTDFGLSTLFAAQIGQLIVPLIKTVTIGILEQLALVSGIIGGISATAWIILNIVQRNKPQAVLAAQPLDQTSQTPANSPPLAPQESINGEYPPIDYQK